MFKRSFLAAALGAGLASLAGQALAADMLGSGGNYNYDQPVAEGPHNWSGNYVGAQIGASSSRVPGPFTNRTGALIGGVAGSNFQTGNFVFGGEVEANFAEAEHRLGNGGSLQQSWNLNAKAKAGYAINNTLIYATLGYGATRFKAKDATTQAPGWQGGAVLGAGVEQAITGPLSVKAEYDYQRFGDVESRVNGVRQSNNLANHAIKVGLNYKF